MLTRERYLHFENIDMSLRQIVSNCSRCGMVQCDHVPLQVMGGQLQAYRRYKMNVVASGQ